MFDKLNVIVNIIIFVTYVFIILVAFQMSFNFILTFIFSLVTLLINIYVSLNNEHKRAFNQLPVIVATDLLFYIQLILSIILVYFSFIPVILGLLMQVIVLAIHLVLVILLIPSKRYVEKVEGNYSGYTDFYQNIKLDINNLVINNDNPDLEKDLDDLKELINYSNPTTSINVKEIDNRILNNFKTLKEKIENQPTEDSKKLISLLSKEIEMRNAKLKH